MISSVVPAATVPVEDRCEVRKVAVQVNVLGVCAAMGPTVQQVTLKHLYSNNWES